MSAAGHSINTCNSYGKMNGSWPKKENGAVHLDVAQLAERSQKAVAPPQTNVPSNGHASYASSSSSDSMENDEPLLSPSEDRFVMYPVRWAPLSWAATQAQYSCMNLVSGRKLCLDHDKHCYWLAFWAEEPASNSLPSLVCAKDYVLKGTALLTGTEAYSRCTRRRLPAFGRWKRWICPRT